MADELSDGRHVLLMRHADAPGFSDPAGYRLDQCGTQRNLGEAGKAQAVRTGQWLSEQGIRQAIVFSSPWCRCIDTASLLNKGPVTIEPSLGSFFGNMSLAKQQTEGLRQLVQASLKRHPQTPIIMVSHHVNIEAYTGVVLGSGEMILVRVDPKGKPLSHRVLAALR
ncbi:MAG: histidine phosphatase family protein [Polynucleobacter sp.]|nr:histidine phosphatase family protein [Polynucleobacter sp.]